MLKQLLISAVFCLLLQVTPVPAAIISLGDSLSDTGNFRAATNGFVPPAPPYFPGRFSSGPVWIEHLARAIGQSAPTPSLTGGTNYAYGGARIAGSSPFGAPDLQTQATRYLAVHSPQPGDLFTVWGGANDLFFAADNPTAGITPSSVVEALGDVLERLALAGAREFIVPNLPPLGLTPSYRTTPLSGVLDAAAAEFNAMLPGALGVLATRYNAQFYLLDVQGLFDDVLADPAAFGFVNTTDSATLLDPNFGLAYELVTPDPDSYVFFDGVHPTGRVHTILGAQAALLVPEPGYLLMLILASSIYFYTQTHN
ncbi:MAG: SGNH/GDSL hydrolase family protein [Pirellulales bacterium]|nr:SGNH/GDSL hydrolase family protein [Pirellulales bacterium]